MMITPISNVANSGPCVFSVPADSGTVCCLASEPPSASTKIIGTNRASSITTPPARLYQPVLVPRPANADPLLLAIEANAYMTSVRPCGPALSIDRCGTPKPSDIAAPISAQNGVARMYAAAHFISVGRIFLPMYSGVRPTMRPPMKTVSTASMSMPYRPAPTPPGTTSPSMMSNSAMPPPNAVNESWNEFTAPVLVTVVDPANSDDPGM